MCAVPTASASDNARLRQVAGLIRHGEEAQGDGDRRRRPFMSTTLLVLERLRKVGDGIVEL